jgi:hypothetical protein
VGASGDVPDVRNSDVPRSHFPSDPLSPMPASVRSTLQGPVAPHFVRETVVALREVVSSVGPVVDMLVHVARDCTKFTGLLLEEIMRQYNTVNSGELRNLSSLLLELLVS